MKRIAIIILLVITSLSFGQNMRRNSFASLFSDQKASKIGDAITVIVVESSQASNKAQTSTSRDSDIGLNASGTVGESPLPNVEFDFGTGNKFNGRGATKSSGMMRTKISALVDSIYANGNLRIKGSRKFSINGEVQTITIVGIVRPADITAENTVLSYYISDAEIMFEGEGRIDDSQSPGWLTKLFHWLF